VAVMNNKSATERAIEGFGLTDVQRQAALERNCDVYLTAGAGSGKTRTLVARYISLLAEEGYGPRNILAVTFTKKAAREMRSRVRRELLKLAETGASDECARWRDLVFKLDAARISTIHSLCAEILRAHPAEARIDPAFGAYEEVEATLLRGEVIEASLQDLAADPRFRELLDATDPRDLINALDEGIKARLKLERMTSENVNELVCGELLAICNDERLTAPVNELSGWSRRDLVDDANQTLADQISALIDTWRAARSALESSDLAAFDHCLPELKRCLTTNTGKKTSRAKLVLKEMRVAHDELLLPLLDTKPTDTPTPKLAPALEDAMRLVIARYQSALDERGALDFDSLESRTVELLEDPAVRASWQNEFGAVLVDEFQDTNARQYSIVRALAGTKPGRLFVVGDAQQSIYRFRQADVRVFHSLTSPHPPAGALGLRLDQTYRTHTELLQATSALFSQILADDEEYLQTYEIPYEPMTSARGALPEPPASPSIEFLLGSGREAEDARPNAAELLAHRLTDLKASGEIGEWHEVALLARASGSFSTYEDAFERWGIPYVTQSGRGMYQRPEIRDTINLLRALANPADDLAMAGALRSPAFGLSDAALYQLRWSSASAQPQQLWYALQHRTELLAGADRTAGARAVEILSRLLDQADRVSAAELLQELIAASDYRAILARDPHQGTAGRLWRNLDKLLDDILPNERLGLRELLEYLEHLNSRTVRESEAEAEVIGAIRLMTIHAAKGLEFKVVVLGDASRAENRRTSTGPLISSDYGVHPAASKEIVARYARLQEARQDAAETKRLLYVALTRARDKLIISGHVTHGKGEVPKYTLEGYASVLLDAASLKPLLPDLARDQLQHVKLPNGSTAGIWLASPTEEGVSEPPLPALAADATLPFVAKDALWQPLPLSQEAEEAPEEGLQMPHPASQAPAEAAGVLVHAAIQAWCFPGDARLPELLRERSRGLGIIEPEQANALYARAVELLERLRAHPLYTEIDISAAERRGM